MPPTRPAESASGPTWIPLLEIAVAVVATYASALGASFQFDDWNVIVDEPRVQTLAAWWASMPGIRPILKLSYAVNHTLGAGPAGFHAVNVAIHAGNAALVFMLLRRRALGQGMEARESGGTALLGALLFALHPVQTEAVTYVSGRSTSLAALFSLASIVAWVEGRARERKGLSALSPAFFAIALLVKETVVVVPFVLVLWELAGVRRAPHRQPRIPRLHFAILGAAALGALASPMYNHLLATSLGARGIGTNLLTQAHAIVYLAGQLVRVDRLNADPVIPVIDAWTVPVTLEAAAIVALLVLAIVFLRRGSELAFGILWFFLWLAPTNSLLPRLDVANDRQLYLALLGPAWLVAWTVGTILPRRRAAFSIAATLVLACPLAVATHFRNQVYADEIVFWQDVARKSPENGRAFNNLGYAYALASRDDDAETAFRRALALDPGDTRAGVNLRLLREGALIRGPRRP